MEWTTPSPSSRTSSGTSRRRVQTEVGTASQTIAMSNGGAKNPPTDGEASDLAMRLLKRMKPNDLRKIRKAAKVLEKTKIENMKKVCAIFVDYVHQKTSATKWNVEKRKAFRSFRC